MTLAHHKCMMSLALTLHCRYFGGCNYNGRLSVLLLALYDFFAPDILIDLPRLLRESLFDTLPIMPNAIHIALSGLPFSANSLCKIVGMW